jgi:hypothetical protein
MAELERTVMARFLEANTPIAPELRAQYAAVTVVRRDLTGVGFFIDYAVPVDVPRVVSPNLEMGERGDAHEWHCRRIRTVCSGRCDLTA